MSTAARVFVSVEFCRFDSEPMAIRFACRANMIEGVDAEYIIQPRSNCYSVEVNYTDDAIEELRSIARRFGDLQKGRSIR